MSQLLATYTRNATGAQYANSQDVAYSAHFAVRSKVTGAWEPLNGNYGIFYAAGVVHSDVPREARKAARAYSTMTVLDHVEGEVSGAVKEKALTPAIDIDLKRLKDPFIFNAARGYGIVATQIARGAGLDGNGQGAGSDGSEINSVLIAYTSNFIEYTYCGLLTVETNQGVLEPQIHFDSDKCVYELSWKDFHGDIKRAVSNDIFSDTHKGIVLTMIEGEPCRDSLIDIDVEDATAASVLEVDDAVIDELTVRFGRVYNVSASIPPVDITEDIASDTQRLGEVLQNVSAELIYSDGSTARRKIIWDDAQIKEFVAQHNSGKRFITGQVHCPQYPVPFAAERADPSIFAWQWRKNADTTEKLYLFIATEDEKGNCIDPRGGNTHMPLRVAHDIYSLSDEAGGRLKEIDILKAGDKNADGRVMTGCFWAPELHVIAGRLSILFMPCFDGEEFNPDGVRNDRFGKPDMWTGRCHIMQLKKDAEGYDLDPRIPENWDRPVEIISNDGGILNPTERISLDMSVIHDSGKYYYVWQQVGSVWAAQFDENNPARLVTRPRQIIFPEFSWDNVIAEGPNAFVRDGKIYLIYSGSSVGIDYTTGLAVADAGVGKDLTDPLSWEKLGYPIQKSSLFNGKWQLGTGHGMWSHDEDDNLIYVFHAAPYNNGVYVGRNAHVRRVHWSKAGMPIFDMQADEELNPKLRRLAVEVRVKDERERF